MIAPHSTKDEGAQNTRFFHCFGFPSAPSPSTKAKRTPNPGLRHHAARQELMRRWPTPQVMPLIPERRRRRLQNAVLVCLKGIPSDYVGGECLLRSTKSFSHQLLVYPQHMCEPMKNFWGPAGQPRFGGERHPLPHAPANSLA